ncbi:hypothetical protein EI94DRAFT_195646 [Lactarius quietus]|nr:hypothetical protein EI94DRAFT_195646 [Lactarius quietus]
MGMRADAQRAAGGQDDDYELGEAERLGGRRNRRVAQDSEFRGQDRKLRVRMKKLVALSWPGVPSTVHRDNTSTGSSQHCTPRLSQPKQGRGKSEVDHTYLTRDPHFEWSLPVRWLLAPVVIPKGQTGYTSIARCHKHFPLPTRIYYLWTELSKM